MHSGSKDQWAQGCLHSDALCLCIQLLSSVLRPVLPGVNKVGASSRDPKGRILLVPGTHYRKERLLSASGAEGKHNDSSPRQWPPRPSYLFLIKMRCKAFSSPSGTAVFPFERGLENTAPCTQIFASKDRRPCLSSRFFFSPVVVSEETRSQGFPGGGSTLSGWLGLPPPSPKEYCH